MRTDEAPVEIYLSDYQKPSHFITETYLSFEIYEEYTVVRSRLSIKKNTEVPSSILVLHGQDLELLAVSVDGKLLGVSDYVVDSETLTIEGLDGEHELSLDTRIQPHLNTSLEGLYKSRVMFCTQCEAEGFRKITYYLDRPDVMSKFTTRVEANKEKYPVLLSNGNAVNSGDMENNRHWVEWHDPHLKPCYLFALVAGDLAHIDSHFTTASGREVLLRIFVEEKDLDKCDHAMQSLKHSMRWDEETYGREYDLDIFMIVAVDDFNMGAMENKGLNIFNTSCVLAKPETTTDDAYQRVEAVVAHEYFHNWSGNRVTCRDWFQLSLKEGFTVFRDSQFSADMGSPTVKRVEDVSLLRSFQFSEDAGPTAHPVRPSSFIEISNFYTMTIYEKGAEIVRMIKTLLGPVLFRQGSDLYFERHDGQAVTIEAFIQAMADVSGRDFSQFMLWYQQAGTPEIHVSENFDALAQRYQLTFKQTCRPTPETKNKKPFFIPVELSLLGTEAALPLSVDGPDMNMAEDKKTCIIELTEATQTVTFTHVAEKPVPSLLRGFSAPVKLHYRCTNVDLLRIMQLETDGFCRWDAAQQLAINEINRVMEALKSDPLPSVSSELIESYRALLKNPALDPAMVALMLSLPSEKYLGDLALKVDVESIHHARLCVQRKMAKQLRVEFMENYQRLNAGIPPNMPYSSDAASIANRSLKNAALYFLVLDGKEDAFDLVKKQFESSTNMTDELAAFRTIVHSGKSELKDYKVDAIQSFYEKWENEPLVVNHWLSVQATQPLPDALVNVKTLMQHEAYDSKNPNKLRSLVGAFCSANVVNFHAANGEGYAFLAEQVIVLNKTNPQIASRMLAPLTKWRRYDEHRAALMKTEIEKIRDSEALSKDVYEIVTKTLAST